MGYTHTIYAPLPSLAINPSGHTEHTLTVATDRSTRGYLLGDGPRTGPNAVVYARGTTGSARPVVDRLMAIVRRGGGATSSPGTLRGNPTPLESLAVGDEDRAWVTARAAEQTVSGTIWVHEGACWVRNQVARFR